MQILNFEYIATAIFSSKFVGPIHSPHPWECLFHSDLASNTYYYQSSSLPNHIKICYFIVILFAFIVIIISCLLDTCVLSPII